MTSTVNTASVAFHTSIGFVVDGIDEPVVAAASTTSTATCGCAPSTTRARGARAGCEPAGSRRPRGRSARTSVGRDRGAVRAARGPAPGRRALAGRAVAAGTRPCTCAAPGSSSRRPRCTTPTACARPSTTTTCGSTWPAGRCPMTRPRGTGSPRSSTAAGSRGPCGCCATSASGMPARIVGWSSYLEIVPKDARLEIGNTATTPACGARWSTPSASCCCSPTPSRR